MEINIFEYLRQEIKDDVVYLPNRGNGGDALIAEGTFQIFERLGIKYSIFDASDDYTGKTVLLAGGGNLVQYYDYLESIIIGLQQNVKRLIILPHTINHKDKLLESLDSRVDIICRERVSYDYVNAAATGGARVFLTDDLAFSIDANQLLNGGLLSRYFFFAMPGDIKTFSRGAYELRKHYNRFGRGNFNAFRIDCESAGRDQPDDNLDISSFFLYSMGNRSLVRAVTSQIMLSLSKYDVINTDRLHLCIAAYLVQKPVNFYGNSYYKNRAIYDYSLRHRSKEIKFLE